MQFNEIFIRYWFFFFNLWKKNLNRSTEGRPTIQFGRRAKPEARRWEGWAKPKGEPTSQKASTTTAKRKHKFRVWNVKRASRQKKPKKRKTSTKREETRPCKGRARGQHGQERTKATRAPSPKEPKNGKPSQERASRSRCPRGRQNRRNKKPTKERPRGQNQTRQKQKGGQKNSSNLSAPIGFSRLACRERSERNAKREKTYIIFAGGTDAKILNPFPKEIPLVLICRRNGCI